MDNYSSDDNHILWEEIGFLEKKIEGVSLPPVLKENIFQMIKRLKAMIRFGGYAEEYDRISHYIDWVVSLPWSQTTTDILDLERAKEIMDKNHYGMEKVKERILEYIAVLKLTQGKEKITRAPVLCLVGLVGTGKTSFAYSLAETLGRKFARIPFGGMGSALDLRGQSRLHPDNEPGQVIKALRRAGSKNPVILLDEIDRVGENSRADIMGVLVELLDPEQNQYFIDHYIDYPFDLSDVLFLATCNNTSLISTAVLDRMEIIQMPSYTDEEKIVIGRDYLLPKILRSCGLTSQNLVIDNNLWPKIVRPLGFDSGIRSLERTIESICRRVAKMIVEGKSSQFLVNETNLKEFIRVW